MVYVDKHDQRRTRAIAKKLNEQGSSARTIAQALDVSARTVKRWRHEGFREAKPLGRPIEHEVDDVAPLIREFLRENMNATIDQIREYLREDHAVDCGRSTISRLLQKDAVTHKKSTYTFSECTNQPVADFKQRLATHEGTIYALDEAAFMLNHAPRTGWAPRGRRVIQQKPGIRGQRYSLLLCVRNSAANPIVYWLLTEGSVTALLFHNILSNLELDDDNVMIVLDNARIHKATAVLQRQGRSTIAELAEERGITMNYLAPYMPTLNPVEYCFNTIRHFVEQNKPRDEASLRAAITQGMQSLNNMEATFLHAFQNMCNPPPGW
jgi:transposase